MQKRVRIESEGSMFLSWQGRPGDMVDPRPITPRLGLAAGGLLILVGLVASAVTALSHLTSLIPVVFGVVLVVLGILGRRDDRVRGVTWGIGIVGLLAALGSVRSIMGWMDILRGVETSVVATLAQSVVLVVGVVLAVAAARELSASK